MYVAITNMVETMCQNMKCIVSNSGVFISVIRIRILVIFRAKNAVRAARSAFSLTSGAMFAVDSISAIRR